MIFSQTKYPEQHGWGTPYGVVGKRTNPNPNLKTYICQFRNEPEKPYWTIHSLLSDSTEFD